MFIQSRHMSMPDIALGPLPYTMDHTQQAQLNHMTSAHTYAGTSFNPIQEFPPNSANAQMPGQVYDPQLVGMNSQMGRNEMIPEHYGSTDMTNFETTLDNNGPDMLQYWLSQADSDFGHGILDIPDTFGSIYGSSGDPSSMQPPARPATVSDASDIVSTGNIPNERFARVESCWLSGKGEKSSPGPKLWENIWSCPGPNIFTSPRSSPAPSGTKKTDSRWGIDAELKQRLEREFGMSAPRMFTPAGNDSFPQPSNLGVPPPEVLDICLDAYFRRFHALAPFVHIPTFNASTAPLPLLYAMCLLGLSAVKQNVGGNFIKHAFRVILRRVMGDLAADAMSTVSLEKKLSTFAAGCLTLNLAALLGDPDQISQGQVLHATLLSTAQKQGLFFVEDFRVGLNTAEAAGEVKRWQAWARMESVKRLTVCLLIMDWWFSAYSSSAATVHPESIQICLPSDNVLFNAESHNQWVQLINTGKYRLSLPLLKPRAFHIQGSLDALICLDPPLHAFGQYSLLCVIQHWQCDMEHRHSLLSEDRDAAEHLIPWRAIGEDSRDRSLVSIVARLAAIVTATPKTADLNARILWHSSCMTLNANLQIFELAAGRGGAGPAGKALEDITKWTQTPSARRACIHAAQIFKLLHNRKVSDPITINALTALFFAALVLGLYLFVVPRHAEENINGTLSYDVLEEVDWILVGQTGMTDTTTMPSIGSGVTFNHTNRPIPAVAFIECGGMISIGGAAAAGGYTTARRTILDFATVMDDMGTWKPKTFSKILHIMSDVLEEAM